MKTFILISLLIVSLGARSQQIPFSTIFVENPFIFNPAVAGSDNGFKIRLTTRVQWLGFGDAPYSNILSAYGPHAVKPMGYGGNIMMDKTGPITLLKASGGYAYNFFLSQDARASLGLNLGLIQYSLNTSSLQFPSGYDPNRSVGNGGSIRGSFSPILSENISRTMPDAGVGLFVYHFDWYIGLSAQQLFPNSLKLVGSEYKNDNNLQAHFYGYAGYKFTMVSNFVIEPTILFRMVPNLPTQTDICAKVVYDNMLWGGLSARNSYGAFDAFNDFSITFGYIHARRIYIALSYDIVFGSIKGYTPGSIEIVLGYNFDDLKRGR